MELAKVLKEISAAKIASSSMKMLMRHAVELAMKCGHSSTCGDVEAPAFAFIEVAADVQVLAEDVVGKPLGSPGRAFAAVRSKLPPHLRTRVQRAVRARNGAAHPARTDPELLKEVKLCFDMIGSEGGSTAEGSGSEAGLSSPGLEVAAKVAPKGIVTGVVAQGIVTGVVAQGIVTGVVADSSSTSSHPVIVAVETCLEDPYFQEFKRTMIDDKAVFKAWITAGHPGYGAAGDDLDYQECFAWRDRRDCG